MPKSRRHDEDDDDILRARGGMLPDGGRVRVPMMMRDSSFAFDGSTWRDVETGISLHDHLDRGRRESNLQDGSGNQYSGHKPGYVLGVDKRQAQVIADAYRQMDEEESNRWRTVPNDPVPSGPMGIGGGNLAGQREGDICQINGAPGKLVRQGSKLVCRLEARARPEPLDHMTQDQRERDRKQAYEDYDRMVENAWKDGL
jgi:hypothetical protein